MTSISCTIAACPNVKDGKQKVSFHYFRSEWASKLEVEGCLKEAVKNKRFICSEHFKPEYIIIRDDKAFLLPQAVPELKLTASVSTSRPKPKPRSVQKALDDSLTSRRPTRSNTDASSLVYETPPQLQDRKPNYNQLMKKYGIKRCGLVLKKFKLKCIIPSCDNSGHSTYYCAQTSRSSKPQYIILCVRHRDVTKPYLQSYLNALLGGVQSLRRGSITSNEDNDEDCGIELSYWKRNKAKTKSDNRDNETKTDEDSRASSSLSEFPDLVEIPPPKGLKTNARTQKRKHSDEKTEEFDEKKVENLKKEKIDIEEEKKVEAQTSQGSLNEETISIESEEEEKVKKQVKEEKEEEEEEETKCCITNCKSKTVKQGGKFFVSKVGEEPNVEYVILCEKHKSSLANADDVFPVTKTAHKTPEFPKANQMKVNKTKPENTILERVDYLPQSLEQSLRRNSNHSTPSPPVILDVPEVTSMKKNRIINEQVVQLMSNDGIKDYIMREFEDKNVIYVPMSQATKSLTKAKPIAPAEPTITRTPRNEPKQLENAMAKSNNASPVAGIGQANLCESQLVYLQGNPFILTKVGGLESNALPTKVNTLGANQSGELTVNPPAKASQNRPGPAQSKYRQMQQILPKIVSVKSMAKEIHEEPEVTSSEPVPIALQIARNYTSPPQYPSTSYKVVGPSDIRADVSGVIQDKRNLPQSSSFSKTTVETRVFKIGDKEITLQKGQKLPNFAAMKNQPTPMAIVPAVPSAPRIINRGYQSKPVQSIISQNVRPQQQQQNHMENFTILRRTIPKPVNNDPIFDPLQKLATYRNLVVKNVQSSNTPVMSNHALNFQNYKDSNRDPFENVMPNEVKIIKVQSLASQQPTTSIPNVPYKKAAFAKKSSGSHPRPLPSSTSAFAKKSTGSHPRPLPQPSTSVSPNITTKPLQHKPDSTQKDQQKEGLRIYSVTLSWTKKDGVERDTLVMMSTPIFYCQKCDTRFPGVSRLTGHEKFCQSKKDPLIASSSSSALDEERKMNKIYICQRCNCTGYNALSMYTHLRRCMKTNEAIAGENPSVYLCSICRATTDSSLGNLIMHMETSCPVYAPDVKIEPTDSDDIVVIDDDDDD